MTFSRFILAEQTLTSYETFWSSGDAFACIRMVSGPNLGRETAHVTEVLRDFLQCLQANAEKISPRLFSVAF